MTAIPKKIKINAHIKKGHEEAVKCQHCGEIYQMFAGRNS